MSTTVELGRMRDQRDAAMAELDKLRAAVQTLADESEARGRSDRADQMGSSGSQAEYWAGCADTIFDVADDLRNLLGADS